MENLVHSEPLRAVPSAKASSWRDLREWLTLLQAHGELKTIDAPVDLDEELSAITYVAAQRNSSRALFRNSRRSAGRQRSHQHAGCEQGRYALAVGLDPSLSVPDMIAASRDLMNRRLPPVMVPKDEAR